MSPPLALRYDDIVRNSERVAWTVDQVMPSDTRLNFGRPFLPAGLAASGSGILGPEEELAFNQIQANAYLHLFFFIEEYIVDWAADLAHAELTHDKHAARALLRFSDDELKHQALFRRYQSCFDRDFGHRCELVDGEAEVAGSVLRRHPIAVLLATFHLEIMTQTHYVGSVEDATDLDPFFASLLRHHWLEEAQHVGVDTLQLRRYTASEPDSTTVLDDYAAVVTDLRGVLRDQAERDICSLESVCNRRLPSGARARLGRARSRALTDTFLGQGMRHALFLRACESALPGARARIAGLEEALR